MFSRLPESNARRQRRLGGFTVSTLLHLVLIALAVRATAWPAPRRATVERVPIFYAAPERTTDPPPSTPRPTSSGPSRTDASLPRELPPVIGPIADITNTIPPAGAMRDLIRSDDFRASGVGHADAVSYGPPNVGSGDPLTERFVDRVVIAIPGTAPRYPTALQSAAIEGDVRAQFVVDTLGRVEEGSVRILEATHDLFARAVRDALARARFTPAEARGRKVRQLAEQTFTFRITGR